LPGRGEQAGAEVGVGDAGQRLGALADVLAPEVGDAVFGDHVVDVAAAGHHPRPLFEDRLDAADRPLPGGGRQRDDRFSSQAARRAADEVDLAANTGTCPRYGRPVRTETSS
jgi:hypothetical protein